MSKGAKVLLDKHEVARRLCIKNRQGEIDGDVVYDRVYGEPGFPKPVRMGSKHLRWREDEIDAYIASLEAVEPIKRSKKKGGEQ